MTDWTEAIVFGGAFLVTFAFVLTRIQRRSKTIMQESIQISRERIQQEKEMLALQKEKNELLKQVISKLDRKA
jgi:hypothetical protein